MSFSSLIISPALAAILTFLYINLSFKVIKIRQSNKIIIGSGNNENLKRAIRAHGNFIEYVPLFLILSFFLEINSLPRIILAIFGIIFIYGRFCHFRGIEKGEDGIKLRIRAMKITFIILVILAFLNLVIFTKLLLIFSKFSGTEFLL
jgi:hypothetical protein